MIIAPSLQIHINILYEVTTSGLPSGITFASEAFVRPEHITIPTLLTNLNQNIMNKTNITTYPTTMLDKNIKKYILMDVDINHPST